MTSDATHLETLLYKERIKDLSFPTFKTSHGKKASGQLKLKEKQSATFKEGILADVKDT